MKVFILLLLLAVGSNLFSNTYVLMKNNVVVNVIECTPANIDAVKANMPGVTAIAGARANIGDVYANGVFTAPPKTLSPAVTAMKAIFATEVDRLNVKYPTLNLIAESKKDANGVLIKADDLSTAIPKLIAAEVSREESAYLFSLFDIMKQIK